jgi:hypothetical protein
LSVHEDRLDANRNPFRRWKALVALSAATVLLHVALLGGAAWTWPGPDTTPPSLSPSPVLALQVRTVPVAAEVAPADVVVAATRAPAFAAPDVAPEPVAALTQRALVLRRPAAARPEPATRSDAAPAEPESLRALEPAPQAEAEPVRLALEQAPVAASKADASQAAAAPAAESDSEPVPTYRTQAPPSATLRYLMQRGLLRGTGELHWHSDGDHYEMRLDGSIAGLTILTQVSQGGFDGAGLAPVRFTDQRLRGNVQAANFQRQAGKITFSGPSTEYPIWPGAQDRLSWMVQLSAIAAADPGVMKPGGRIAMHVLGARGDAAIWAMRYVGREAVETLGASVMAEKFVREPQSPHDTAVEIWLDPQRHHLPIRATLRNGNDGDALELVLQQLTLAP